MNINPLRANHEHVGFQKSLLKKLPLEIYCI